MSPRLEVRPLLTEDLAACGELLAARHRADAGRLPYLEPAISDPATATEAVRGALAQPGGEGVAALRGRRLVGFCIGTRMAFSARDLAAQFLPLRSALVPGMAHAVADGEDRDEVYLALYAGLAEGWVRDGILVHRVEVTAGDRATEDAWVALGFGRAMTAATRWTSDPVAGGRGDGIRVDVATAADLDAVRRLSRELAAHHRRSPMFWPPVLDAEPATDAFLAAALAGEAPTFLAWQGAEPIGMQLFLLPGFTPAQVRSDQRLYLFEGVVSPSARGTGVGSALLAASMAWAAEHGHELCTLHWAAGNFLGAPFWLGHAFVPVVHTLERRVDERALWARGEPGHTG
jgi:GNAT superfamily N-acetyltransferase